MNNVFSETRQVRFDNLQNLVTGMGVQGKDPSLSARFLRRPTLGQEDQSILLQNGIMRKIASILPEAATTCWGVPTMADGDTDTIEAIVDALENIKVVPVGDLAISSVQKAFSLAMFNAFVTGNGAIVIHTIEKKELDLTTPIDLKILKSIRKLAVMDRWDINPVMPLDKTSEVTKFQITGGGEVHATRVLWFVGEKLDYQGKLYNNGCDESIFDGINESFKLYVSSLKGLGRSVQNLGITDIAVEGLYELGDKQIEAMRKRAELNMQLRSTYNAQMRDKTREEINQLSNTITGFPEAIEVLKNWFLSNTNYTRSLILQELSAGLTASGKSQAEKDIEIKTTAKLQADRLTHHLTGRNSEAPGLLTILCACTDGPTKGKIPEKLKWKWNPLYVTTPTEQADLEMNRGQMAITIAQGSPEFLSQYLLSAYGGNEYNPVITITPEYKKLLQDQAALIPPPAPDVDEYGNPIGTEYEEAPIEGEAEPAPEEPQTDSADDPIDRMVRESVKKGLLILAKAGNSRAPDRWMKDFADGAELDSGDLVRWRSFWRNPKPKTELEKMLHGGRWGKMWGNRS